MDHCGHASSGMEEYCETPAARQTATIVEMLRSCRRDQAQKQRESLARSFHADFAEMISPIIDFNLKNLEVLYK